MNHYMDNYCVFNIVSNNIAAFSISMILSVNNNYKIYVPTFER